MPAAQVEVDDVIASTGLRTFRVGVAELVEHFALDEPVLILSGVLVDVQPGWGNKFWVAVCPHLDGPASVMDRHMVC